MNAPFAPEQPPEPLKIEDVHPIVTADGVSTRHAITLTLNRQPTELELRMYRELPPTPQMFLDVRSYIERMNLAELVARLFEFYILGGLVLPDTPQAMDWLRSYMKGVGHGPLGSPLRWPVLVASAHNLLTRWGFAPSDDGFVAKKPG